MPPKRTKKAAEPALREDVADELDPSQPVLNVEHCRSCRVFRRRAEELHAALRERGLRQMQLRLNAAGAPRRGAFELSLNVGEGTQEQVPLWSGLKRGPPRALKFPTVEEVYDRIQEILGLEQQNKDLPKKIEFGTGESQKNSESKDLHMEEAIAVNLEGSNKVPSKALSKKTTPAKSEVTDIASGNLTQEQKSEEEHPKIDLKEQKEEKPSKRLPKTRKKLTKSANTKDDNHEEQPQTSQKRKRPTRSSTDETSSSSKRRK
uniref:Selenoprotein BthD n=1 Tax=Drosophila rhopaloa TaxID=1041015 RepID=A0ABM5H4M1_DRORH